MSAVEDGFQIALAALKKRLTPEEQDEFSGSSIEKVRSAIACIQSEHGSEKKLQNMARLRTFLEAMDQFGGIVEVFLNTSEFVAFIWGPIKFMLQVASKYADTFDILLDAYKQIGEQIPLLSQYQELFKQPRMQRFLEMMYTDILEFHKRAMRFFSGPVWHQIFRSLWKDFRTRFKYILDQLRNHREYIESQAHLLHFQQYGADRVQTLAHIRRTEQEEQERKYKEVLAWMSGTSAMVDQETACAIREEYPSTGRWILEHPKLHNWKHEETPISSILWLNGIPGAGKTILASVIIEECLKSARFKTSFFYCKEGDPDKNTSTSILKGLLCQLICECRDLVPYCHDKFNDSGELTLTSASTTRQLMDLLCQRIPKHYIIIDGLDECAEAERKSLLSFLTTIVHRYDLKEPGKLRILCVSQDYNDIRKSLESAEMIVLGATDNGKDIETFVSRWITKIREKFEVSDDEAHYIKESTCSRSKSMFLFAKLVMMNLHAQTTRKKLLQEISTSRFPKGIGQAYERILSRIKDNATTDQWKIAQILLGWMVCSKRPLKWQEIQAAASVDPVDQTFDFDNRKLRIHIRDLCGSLIQVLAGDRVELVHTTAKHHITSTGHVHTALVECNMTALCLQYLTFECFEKDCNDEKLKDFATKGYLVLQDYAIANWSHHLRALVNTGQQVLGQNPEIRDAVQEFSHAVTDFTDFYEDDLRLEEISDSSQQACEAFAQCDFYLAVQSLWNHIDLHMKKGFEAKTEVSLTSLGQALARNRTLIEDFTLPKDLSMHMQKSLNFFYGDKRYKCPKLTCYYFHEGFEDAKSRKVHIDRHDRPFRCTYPDCSVQDFGFRSSKELEKHQRSFHPEEDDMASIFAIPKTIEAKTPWACDICPKKFTRGFHLRSHIRAHKNERPFACSECGKKFTRENDRKRHEKLHARP